VLGSIACCAVVAVTLIAAGCGGDGEQESESARTECKREATSRPTGLPAAFLFPGELTITEVLKHGPTNVVDGYWTAELDEAYDESKDQVDRGGLHDSLHGLTV
jgi:hypothetical protein